ncbi:MAG: ATP-binding cassette domain-containing protein [Proteobacteria bacterium]|nr:ATP-binding cassette domain-containing protein [Pseudomonadota bacterium]
MVELLTLENVWAGYGDAIILEDISLCLGEADSLALLGRNGMGKTTLLSTLMGVTRLKSGRMRYRGQDLSVVPAHGRAKLGLGWVPQERDIFPSLSVEENLTVVARPGLAMARALMLNPKVLLLDEPLEGLAPLIVQDLLRIIGQMVSSGEMAVILVEQHAYQILPLMRQALVLERGRVVFSGDSEFLRRDRAQLDKWLGVGAH